MTGTAAVSAPQDRSRAAAGAPRRHLARADRWALLVLVAVPLGAFVVPALAGYPAISGDNLIQNFPLRVLAGHQLRQGHLPLWNTYIWSGSALLGGLNAGALYPLTLVFAVLPAAAAWVVNLVVAYWAAGLALYVLLRQFRLSPLACLLGAATYAYSGAMAGQVVHLPIVQGMSWVPLMVLAQLRLSWAVLGVGPAGVGPAGRPRTSPWPWVVLLAASVGLVLLTGEPRGMAEAEVVGGVVTLWLALRSYPGAVVGGRRRLGLLGYSAVGGLWAAALGAAQLVPGWRFIGSSQRAKESYALFASGSLHPQWSVLLLVPDLFGGDGLLHQPTYFNSYNLPEVVGYAGLLPLVAAAGLLTRAFGRRRDPGAPDWWLWLFLAALGLLMAFGGYTPLGGLFGHIPFFDKVRLQSRNLGIADLALAVLLGFWVDRLGRPDPSAAGLSGWRRPLTALPALAALLLCLVALAVPFRVEIAFGADRAGAALGAFLRPWMLAQLAVVAGSGALVLLGRRLAPTGRRRLAAAVVVADLVLFTASSSTGLVPGHATIEPDRAAATAVLGRQGRFAIYDTTVLNEDDLSTIGQPDLNTMTGLPSVQGYGSLIAGGYGATTGTHDLDTLDPCALQRGDFTPLRLSVLLVLPEFVAPRIGPSGALLAQDQAPPPAPAGRCPGAPAPGGAHGRTFYLGQPLTLTGVTLVPAPGPASGPVRVGLLRASGAVAFPPGRLTGKRGASRQLDFLTPQPAVGVVVRGDPQAVSATSVVTAAGGARYSLDGELQDALGRPQWHYRGQWRLYARFRAPVTRPPVWVAGGGGLVRRLSVADWGTEVDRVRASRPVVVVRSEAYQAGWHVEAESATGRRLGLPVRPDGVVQSVRVPAGRWTLTFLYRPAGLDAGLAATGAGLLALAGAGTVALVRRRRRPGHRPAGPD